jgi:hypothetical protein
MIELTPEQREAVTKNGTEFVRLLDPATKVEYVLIRAEVYDRLKALLDVDMPDAAPLINELMTEDDAKDPYLDSYQHYTQDAP